MRYYMKKEWKKPLLTVVVRGSAEENVLGACKTGAAPPYYSPVQSAASCTQLVAFNCEACSDQGTS